MKHRIELADIAGEQGPTVFSKAVLSKHHDLFSERSALLFTPTRQLPPNYIGSGSIDIFLPLCSPDYYEFESIAGYRSPRLWLDLIQKATGKIRWNPLTKAMVRFTRIDTAHIRDDHAILGMKALRDALKFNTYGRKDGKLLYYFGAIIDDDYKSATFEYHQCECATAENSGVRIQID